jgi:hypothetical protein
MMGVGVKVVYPIPHSILKHENAHDNVTVDNRTYVDSTFVLLTLTHVITFSSLAHLAWNILYFLPVHVAHFNSKRYCIKIQL